MKKLVAYAVLVVALAALIYMAFRPKPLTVEFATVTRGPLTVTVDHEGKTRVIDRYVVLAPLAGMLQRIDLDPGDPVQGGATVLAVVDPLEPSLLDDRTVAEAEARVRAAEASLELAKRRKQRAVEQARLARAEYDRQQELLTTEIGSQQRLEEAERDLRLWEAEVVTADASVEVAKFELQTSRAALERTGSVDGEPMTPAERRLRLVAPVDGVVFRVLRESAGPVAIGEALLELGDPANLEIEADYLSTDAVRIRPGMAAWIEDWGGDEPLPARVRVVEPSGFTKISALGVEEQRVNVILDLLTPAVERPPLGDAFRVQVRVELWRGDDVVQVPEGSLFRVGEGWGVYLVREGRARLRAVDVGQRNGLQAEVLDGPEPGDRVVLHPPDSVEDGVLVQQR